MLHVAYKDAAGNDRDWFHGFYFEPPPENYILYNQPDNSSERIARFVWYPYESVNLLTTLGPAKPVFVKSIRIYASGLDLRLNGCQHLVTGRRVTRPNGDETPPTPYPRYPAGLH